MGKFLRHRSVGNVFFFVGSLTILAACWEWGVAIFNVPPYLVPPLSDVLASFAENRTYLLENGIVTGYQTLLGFALAIAISLPLANLMTYSRVADRMIFPWLVSSQVVPKVAVAPLFVVWFGFGIVPKVLLSFLISFFPVVISTTVGLKSTEREMLFLARSMGGGVVNTFLKVRLPHALPVIFGGLKVGITLAVVGAIVGEFVGSSAGLGYVLMTATGSFDMPLLFASLIAMILLGVGLFGLVELSERLLMPWRRSLDSSSERVAAATA